MYSEETLYSIALRNCPSIGDSIFYRLVSEMGSAKNVWLASKSDLLKHYRIGNKIISEIGNNHHLSFAEEELNFCQNNNISILLRHVDRFPGLLSECEDAPSILYVKGIYKENKNNISIVGTRNITSYGKTFINDFLSNLKDKNVQTISGLAIGVDAEVHERSLYYKIPTVGVLAHGFHTFYPSKNRKLYERILENNDCVMTEFNSRQDPVRENFIKRNRIIAGISPTTIITETAYGGGSMNTANYANIYNREVLALPGNIDHKQSQGCNLLISQNKARIISHIAETIEYLGLNDKGACPTLFSEPKDLSMLSEEQLSVYTIISKQENISLDEITIHSEIPTYKILSILLELELQGLISVTSSRQYYTK